MESRRDERAVTVQIGAVLLLAIVFTALALYQVNAVPAENSAVEYEHNQQVHGEMHELRNAIKNVGTSGGSESVSITLGTQYPTRTFSMNPSAPAGTLETTGTQTLRIGNADVISDHGGSSDPENLIGEHSTTTLRYQPDYNEYRGAPTTRIEHGFAYNDFSDAQVSLTDQPLIDGDRITIVLLEGNLSAGSTGATAVDTRLLDGPTDPVTIEPDGGEITLTVPTQAPDAWNESLQDEPAASVTGFSDGALTITLEDDEYELQMARVGIGDASDDGSDEFDISRSETSTTNTSEAYDVHWDTTRIASGDDQVSCTDDHCTVTVSNTGDTVPVFVETTPAIDDATVEYAVSDNGIAQFDPGTGVVQNGEHTTDLEAWSNGTVTGFVSSGGSGDTVTFEVTVTGAETGPPQITDFTVTDESECSKINSQNKCTGSAGINKAIFGVTWATDDAETVTVTVTRDGEQLATYSGTTGGETFEENDQYGSEYQIEIVASNETGDRTAVETVTAGG
ncbi:hypothetical protein E2L06_08180 [Haloterrigena sp. H1]|uniref:hypothetical protein n=1 Tax=Haloterrigena sp. H1 TaxID=2552943 RepID=UPI00110DE520|nr:hypothetical protein [Haloterrigena sp. H1]TMT86582.1 hypothetical protein E2L06_08180 [Haloterrigena sp. H1]